MKKKYITKDSGKRVDFKSGMRRDTDDGKLRLTLNKQARERYKSKFTDNNTTKYMEKIKSMTEEEYSLFRKKKNIASKKYYIKNRDKILKRNKEKYIHTMLRKYNLTLDDYNKIYEDQNKVCAICLKPNTAKLKNKLPLIIDHCHETNKVRGLLCSQCNVMLGMAKDKKEVLKSAIKYLK